MRRSPRCGMGLRARCPTTCAIGIVRDPKTTEPTNIPTTTPKDGSSSATFPMAWSAAASIIRASGVGKLTARMPPPATARRQVIVPRRKAAPRQAIPREGRSATRLLLLLKGSPPPRTGRFRTLPPNHHARQTPLPPPAKSAPSDCSKAAAITARALDGDVASRAIIGCWIIR